MTKRWYNAPQKCKIKLKTNSVELLIIKIKIQYIKSWLIKRIYID